MRRVFERALVPLALLPLWPTSASADAISRPETTSCWLLPEGWPCRYNGVSRGRCQTEQVSTGHRSSEPRGVCRPAPVSSAAGAEPPALSPPAPRPPGEPAGAPASRPAPSAAAAQPPAPRCSQLPGRGEAAVGAALLVAALAALGRRSRGPER